MVNPEDLKDLEDEHRRTGSSDNSKPSWYTDDVKNPRGIKSPKIQPCPELPQAMFPGENNGRSRRYGKSTTIPRR